MIALRTLLGSDMFLPIQAHCRTHKWMTLRDNVSPGDAAWLVILLEMESETTELFPRGKWPTIQRIHNLLRAEARRRFFVRP